MKNRRQEKILELIAAADVDTQEALQKMLINCGFPVTQATISRDIRELKLMKTSAPNGGYRYVIAGKYICVYRLIAETVYVYHIAHGASNYPTLFKRLLKEEKQ